MAFSREEDVARALGIPKLQKIEKLLRAK